MFYRSKAEVPRELTEVIEIIQLFVPMVTTQSSVGWALVTH